MLKLDITSRYIPKGNISHISSHHLYPYCSSLSHHILPHNSKGLLPCFPTAILFTLYNIFHTVNQSHLLNLNIRPHSSPITMLRRLPITLGRKSKVSIENEKYPISELFESALPSVCNVLFLDVHTVCFIQVWLKCRNSGESFSDYHTPIITVYHSLPPSPALSLNVSLRDVVCISMFMSVFPLLSRLNPL